MATPRSFVTNSPTCSTRAGSRSRGRSLRAARSRAAGRAAAPRPRGRAAARARLVALGAGRGGVIATRLGVPMFVAAADVRNLTRAARRPEPGDSLAVIAPRDGVDATGAWWTAWSASPLSPLEVRVYWHCDPGYVEPLLVAALTAALEERRRALLDEMLRRTKLAVRRVDAGALDLLLLAAGLQAKPALARRPRPPRAVARRRGPSSLHAPARPRRRRGAGSPVPAESFGQSRSRAAAEGIVDCAGRRCAGRRRGPSRHPRRDDPARHLADAVVPGQSARRRRRRRW